MNYNTLRNKPTINYRELIGDSTVSEVGGMTAEEFNTLMNTDLASYYTKAQIDELFSRSFIYKEKSGSIVTFDCPSTTNGISEVTSEIEDVQDLHGYDAPWVGGAGKNKLPKTPQTGSNTINGITWTVNDDGSIKVNGTATERSLFYYLPAGSYDTLNGEYTVSVEGLTQGVGNGFQIGGDWGNAQPTFTTTYENATIQQFWFDVAQGKTVNTVIKPMIRLATETDATYAPYENICHISGWSAVNVFVSPTIDASDGTTYTTTLKDNNSNPLTCYGGELSNVNGVQTLTVTHGYIASYNGETLPSTWISDRDVYAEGTTPTTGAEVVYELATPITIPLDNLAIASHSGVNNIWCDSGDITVKALDRIIQG